jgi:archaellum component FlaF (FlaF/FlaG flagellin family)
VGFSLVAAFAVIGVSLFIALEILTGVLMPTLSDFNDSWREAKERRVDEVQSEINITGIVDGVTGTWWNMSFGFRKSITIDHTKVAAMLTNFPVLVDITDSDLKANVMQSNGNDIAFVDSTHTLQYNHQIELYNSADGHLAAWVNITSVSNTVDTTFYLYYGNATCANQQNKINVWDSNYHGVWHLNESSGTLYESTSYGNNGTAGGGPTYNVDGKIAGAMGFDGSNDYVNCGDPADESLDFGTGDFTLECWVKTAEDEDSNILSKLNDSDSNGEGYALAIDGAGGVMNASLYDGSQHYLDPSSISINDGEWHYLGVTFDRDGNGVYYLNGESDGITDIKGWNGDTSTVEVFEFCRANAEGKDMYFDGIIDETRVSNIIRSVAWINTSYLNQNSPSTFLDTGSQTTIYLTITVENTGSVNLKTNDFNILINGTKYQCTCDHPCLYPLNELHFYPTTQIASGAKRIKVISEKGTEDYYEYTG